MIVKKIKRTAAGTKGKPKAWQIADLVDYIRYPHKKNAHEKIAHAGSRNFFASAHNEQKLEMIGLAQESVYSAMPVTHWLFSWKENEQPTNEQVDEVVDIFLEHMGLVGHQVIYALHKDTENFHVHIAVNRMSEETGKVVQPHRGFDLEAAHKIVALIEHKQGWQSEKHSRYVVLENGELAKRRDAKKAVKPSAKAADFEHATGEKSAQRIAQERGHKIITEATSWAELHQGLAAQGLRFEKKGSGAVVFVPSSEEAIAVKASSIDRKFSMGKLRKRLGEYEAGDYAEEVKRVPPEPISSVNNEEWQEYQGEDKAVPKNEDEDESAVAQTETLDALKQRHADARQELVGLLKNEGLPMLQVGYDILCQTQQQEVAAFRKAKKRRRQKRRKRVRPRFETWLRLRGLHRHADTWRHRRAFEEQEDVSPVLTPRQMQEVQNMNEAQAFERYAHAVDAERYRVTCIKMDMNGGKKTFILDKKDGVTKGFTPHELLTRIPEMLRLQARRENIYYTPLSDDKHHILIDDMSVESVTRLKKDGFVPAVILESSPKNYQCLLTIPKVDSPFTREASNRLTEWLNKEYGDPKLSGCIHPHRAPAFGNIKPKHRKPDGSYPRVKLLVAERKQCEKAFLRAREIAKQYEEQARHKEAQRQTHPAPPPANTPHGDSGHMAHNGGSGHGQYGNAPSMSASAAYYAHYDDIRKHMNIQDYSRLDSMIALRMRATGHSPQAVMDAIQHCAPSIRTKEGRDWQKYAERTAHYAFGVAGDVALRKYERYVGQWERVECRVTEATQLAKNLRL